jgi:uncharacterized membrane protein
MMMKYGQKEFTSGTDLITWEDDQHPSSVREADADVEEFARSLGWLSIGLGVAGILAPHALARFLGTRNHGILFRLMGLREIATGIGILSQPRATGWMRARVAGDILDLFALRKAFDSERSRPVNIALASLAVGGITALDVRCARDLGRNDGTATDATMKAAKTLLINITKTLLINRSPEELYGYWRDFQNLPRFMKNLESVEVIGPKVSRWTAKGPAGSQVKWEAEIIDDRSNECIAWRSLNGDVEHTGRVRFERFPNGRGTLVRVEMQYSPPAGAIGGAVAKLFGRTPEQEVEEDLRRFKQMMETGEIITTHGQPAGRSSSTSWKYDQSVRRALD